MILHLPPGSPPWTHVAADAVLYLHIGGATVGLIAGTAALVFRKGSPLHRAAGNLFLTAMLIMSGIGASVAPFLAPPQWTSAFAGAFTFYLALTGWVAAKRPDGVVGRFEVAALLVPLGVAVAGAFFIFKAAQSPTGTVDGSPSQAFYIFVLVGLIAAASDLKVILRRGVSGASRIARHLWRMCFALFVASTSFFLGQQQVMPAFMRGSAWLFVPALAPLGFMVFWLIRVWFTRAFKSASAAVLGAHQIRGH